MLLGKMRLTITVIILSFVQFGWVFAAEVIDLDKIIVTSSRQETFVEDAPSAVTVITNRQIVESGVQDADDLLKNVFGLDISRRSGNTSSTSTVTMRGFGGQSRGRTLVLIDGIPFNEIYGGEVYWNAIPVKEIERIEVVPGAGSALYGPGAMGGVINIITKKPKKLETELHAEYGSHAERSFGLRHQNRIKNFSYFASGGWFKTDGYIAAVDRKSYDIRRNRKDWNADVKLGYDFGEKDSINVGYRHYKEDVNAGRTYYYGSKDLDNLNFSLKKWLEKTEFLGTLYFDWENSSWTYDKSPYTSIDYVNKNPKRSIGGNLQSNIHFSESNTLSLGVDYRWGKADSVDNYQSTVRKVEAKGQQDSLGIYFHDELKFWEKLIVTIGGRWDYWRNSDGYLYDDTLSPKETNYKARSDNSFSPKLGLVYHLSESTTLRSAIGKSFRTPTLYDLYRTWKYGSTTYQSNPNLKPERAYSYEIGFDQSLWEKLLGRFTAYYNDVSDLIYSVGGSTKVKDNVGKVEIYGIETELRYNPVKWLSVFTNYTFNSSKIKKHSDPSLKNKYLTYTPKSKYSFGCNFKNPKFLDLEVVGRYVGHVFHNDANTQKVKQYLIWDITLSRNITDYFELLLKIENVADKRYEEYRGTLAPDRTISASAKIRF